MKPTLINNASSARSRQIGRKALKADGLARALTAAHPRPKKSWRVPSLQPKTIGLLSIAIVIAVALGFGGFHIYSVQTAATQKAVAIKQANETKAKRLAAAACRLKLAQSKADQMGMGKLTYDQLYDHNACDK